MPDMFLHQFPGTLFVLAMLLPLASFLLILLACAGWGAIRPYRETKWGEIFYRLLGGDQGGRTAALIATAAIFLAFLCSLTGFLLFQIDYHAVEQARADLPETLAAVDTQNSAITALDDKIKSLANKELQDAQAERAVLAKDLKGLEDRLAYQRDMQTRLQTAYAARLDWARVMPSGLADPDRGTLLQIGYRIDHLSALMFVMITFVALMIHIFSMSYMSGELAEVVLDHHVAAETDDGFLHRRGRLGRFYLYLSLFCFSMLHLVLADNLFQAFVSWELVGICSYLLIGFHYERPIAANAAAKAFIVNRVGDAGFVIGMAILWTSVGTFNFEDLFSRLRSPDSDSTGAIIRAHPFVRVTNTGTVVYIDDNGPDISLTPRQPNRDSRGSVAVQSATDSTMHYWLLVVAGLGIFAGCVSKSAQFPLQVWLPDAMAGPTPVSALIHAATMVAAGVYMVGRCYPLFTPEVLLVIAYTGAITLFIAASTALVMTDIKKVLAWSTVSQLGYMMVALGVGGWAAALFHLITHAFFKALLFLGCGSVIHGCHHEQQLIKMGGLARKMPITALAMLAGVLAIVGAPLFSGWYSKDAVLAAALGFAIEHRHHALLFIVPLLTVGLTAFYMFRLWFLTFAGQPRDTDLHHHADESPWNMLTPLILLAILSVAVAWGWPIGDSDKSWLLSQIRLAEPACVAADFAPVAHAAHAGHLFVVALALALSLLGLIFALQLYYYRTMDTSLSKQQFPGVYAFLTHKWYFDEVYAAVFVRPTLIVARGLQWFDRVVIDGLVTILVRVVVSVSRWDGFFDRYLVDGLVNLIGTAVSAIGGWLRRWETGSLRNYVLFLVLAAIGIFLVLSWL